MPQKGRSSRINGKIVGQQHGRQAGDGVPLGRRRPRPTTPSGRRRRSSSIRTPPTLAAPTWTPWAAGSRRRHPRNDGQGGAIKTRRSPTRPGRRPSFCRAVTSSSWSSFSCCGGLGPFLLGRGLFLLAEDGVVARPEVLGFGQPDANDAHGLSPIERSVISLRSTTLALLGAASGANGPAAPAASVCGASVISRGAFVTGKSGGRSVK